MRGLFGVGGKEEDGPRPSRPVLSYLVLSCTLWREWSGVGASGVDFVVVEVVGQGGWLEGSAGMGVPGLLLALKEVTRKCHVGEWRGETAAVDAYVWLHKASYGCAEALVRGSPGCASALVRYTMARVAMLRGHGVEPLLVFDGAPLPAKAGTESTRASARATARERAEAYLREGNRAAAFECFQRAVDITPAHARAVQVALDEAGVTYIVAPYEADAQIGYLLRAGRAGLAITEDSDLLAHGCHTVLFKMDIHGNGEAVLLNDVRRVTRAMDLAQFDAAMFLDLCVVAGCDYLPGIPGVALKKAAGLVRRFRTAEGAVRQLRFAGAPVPRDYEDLVRRARLTFLHQRVWCPDRKTLVHATEDAEGRLKTDLAGDTDFLGPGSEGRDPEEVASLARGERCPLTGALFDAGTIRALAGPQAGVGWTSLASDCAGEGGPATRTALGKSPHVRAAGKPPQQNTLRDLWAHDPNGVLTTVQARAKFKPPAPAASASSPSPSSAQQLSPVGGNPFGAFRIGACADDDALTVDNSSRDKAATMRMGTAGIIAGRTDRKRLPILQTTPSTFGGTSPRRKNVRVSKFFGASTPSSQAGSIAEESNSVAGGEVARRVVTNGGYFGFGAVNVCSGGHFAAGHNEDEDADEGHDEDEDVEDDETPRTLAPPPSPGTSLHPVSVLLDGLPLDHTSPESMRCAPLTPPTPPWGPGSTESFGNSQGDPFLKFAYSG